jgi:hypothetical protein
MAKEAHHHKNWGGKRAGSGRQMGSTSKYQKIYEPGQSEPGHRHMEVNNSVEKTFSIEASARGHYPPNSEVVIIITAPSVFIEVIGLRFKFYINLIYYMYVQ